MAAYRPRDGRNNRRVPNMQSPPGIFVVENEDQGYGEPKHMNVLSPYLARTVALVAEGLPNKQIAHQMGISEGTARQYVSHAFRQLNLKDGNSRNKRVLLTRWMLRGER
jgi:DNA-binding NarL/FixJ family response regulator